MLAGSRTEHAMAEFSPNEQMLKVGSLADEFYLKVLREDEEPIFVSDEATLLDVWCGDVNEILKRCSQHYGIPVSLQDDLFAERFVTDRSRQRRVKYVQVAICWATFVLRRSISLWSM
jgi:hypothetical protein